MGVEGRHGVAPGPRGAALLRTLVGLQRDPLATFMELRRLHGDVVRLPFLHRTFYLVTHPDQVAHVLQADPSSYSKGTRTYTKIRALLGDGLVTSDGAVWARQRRLVQPVFHQRRIRDFASAVTELTAETLERWRDRAGRGEVVDVGTEMTRLTLRIAGRVFFGTEVASRGEEIGLAITDALAWIPTPAVAPNVAPAERVLLSGSHSLPC